MFNPTDEQLFNTHKQAALDNIRERNDDQVKAMVGSDLADRVFDALAARRGRFIKGDTVSAFLLVCVHRLCQKHGLYPNRELTPAEHATAEIVAKTEGIPITTALWRAKRAKVA